MRRGPAARRARRASCRLSHRDARRDRGRRPRARRFRRCPRHWRAPARRRGGRWRGRGRDGARPGDRKSVVEGKSVSVRVDLGGRRIIKKKTKKEKNTRKKTKK